MEHAQNIALVTGCMSALNNLPCTMTTCHELGHAWFGNLITCATEGATISYSVNDSDWTEGDNFDIAATSTIKAKAELNANKASYEQGKKDVAAGEEELAAAEKRMQELSGGQVKPMEDAP